MGVERIKEKKRSSNDVSLEFGNYKKRIKRKNPNVSLFLFFPRKTLVGRNIMKGRRKF